MNGPVNSSSKPSLPHASGRDTQRASTIHSIQVMRAVAAMLVVLFHAQQAFHRAGSPTLIRDEAYLFSFGAVGVHIFFVISGFIMVHTTRLAGGIDAKAFLRRRLLRIYPIYWICAGLYLAVHLAIGQPYDLSIGQAVNALLLIPADASRIIGPAWTLSFEMYFYISFAIFMLLGLNRGLLALTGFYLGAIILFHVFDLSRFFLIGGNSLLLEFIAGCAIGWILKVGRMPARGGWLAIGLALLLFAAGIWFGFDRLPSVVIWGVPSTLLVLGCIMVENAAGAVPVIRKVGILGDSSYALYLVHILVITVALTAAKAADAVYSTHALIAAGIIGVLSLGVAELLHRKVEQPLLRVINPRRALVPNRQEPAVPAPHPSRKPG